MPFTGQYSPVCVNPTITNRGYHKREKYVYFCVYCSPSATHSAALDRICLEMGTVQCSKVREGTSEANSKACGKGFCEDLGFGQPNEAGSSIHSSDSEILAVHTQDGMP